MKKEAKSLLDTRKIAQKLATFIKENNNFLIFYLKGNLGSGKTTLVREILKCLFKDVKTYGKQVLSNPTPLCQPGGAVAC